jgi:hypothetical protein
MGAFHGTSDVQAFLKRAASEMASARPSTAFPDRYLQHVAYAVDMVASNDFLSPPSAIASVYLSTRFEFYYRILSGKLKADGTWTTPEAKAAARAVLHDKRLGKKYDRVSSVALAYRIMKTNSSSALARHCIDLDTTLYPTADKKVLGISDIGDRIEFLRNAAGHGSWGDISSEAIFYGLMTALVFYSKT